ncbi:MAG: peptidoglycan-binding protein, partial [Clostridia bacterium]
KPEGDWWVVEAKGVMYGVVKTRLLQDKYWNRWGLMTRYFDYEKGASAFELGERALELGCVGSDVRALQGMLIELGFNLGSYGADGDFGAATHKAVEAFQTKYRLPVTGRMEESDFETLNDAFLPEDPDEPEPDVPEEPAPEEPDAPAASYEIDALDLSSYNSTQFPKIDWEKIKRNVGFLVLRCGCTRLKNKPLGVGGDVSFEKWAKKCNEMNIPFWAYYYSNPKDLDQAREEARFAYDVAEKYHPVGYCMDCEEASL